MLLLFVALGLLWAWAALMFAVRQNTFVWAFVLVAVGLAGLVAGIVGFRRVPKERRRVFTSEPKDPL